MRSSNRPTLSGARNDHVDYHNSQVSWWIFYTSCTNGNRNEYSTQELQNNPVSPHYLIKLKPHKTAHSEVRHHGILLRNSNELSELFYVNEFVKRTMSAIGQRNLSPNQLQVLIKMSNFCTDTRSQRFLIKILLSKLNAFYLN